MADENIQQHLQALKQYITAIKNGDGDLAEIQIKKKQLSAIQSTIKKLEKNNVPVPESLNNEKLTLISELTELETASNGCIQTYETMLNIILELSRVCNRLPHKDLYRRIKEWRKQTTSPEILRKAIATALKEFGGTAKERDILSDIEKKYSGKFTPADLEQTHGKKYKWQTNLHRERKKMIADGILTPESKASTWTLVK